MMPCKGDLCEALVWHYNVEKTGTMALSIQCTPGFRVHDTGFELVVRYLKIDIVELLTTSGEVLARKL